MLQAPATEMVARDSRMDVANFILQWSFVGRLVSSLSLPISPLGLPQRDDD
jgi:hypothetical protein